MGIYKKIGLSQETDLIDTSPLEPSITFLFFSTDRSYMNYQDATLLQVDKLL